MKQKPALPPPMPDYKTAIVDYLIKMKGVSIYLILKLIKLIKPRIKKFFNKKVIEETIARRWPDLNLRQVLFVFSVPAEWVNDSEISS